MYAGRFAPSPTGPLHFGSLVAALASWLDARAAKGRWHVRIEDIDRPREEKGAAADVLRSLERLGLYWDGPVGFQSQRNDHYERALQAFQIHLQRLLGYPEPRYLHVPVAVNAAGEKLSKQTGAAPIDWSRKRQLLAETLRFLGQPDADDLAEAVRNWNPARIPVCRTIALA